MRESLDPSQVLKSDAVAFFYVGGNEKEGDPESLALGPGDTPIEAVAGYLRRRLGDGAFVSLSSAGPKLICTGVGWDGKPYTYETPVKVEARKPGKKKRGEATRQ